MGLINEKKKKLKIVKGICAFCNAIGDVIEGRIYASWKKKDRARGSAASAIHQIAHLCEPCFNAKRKPL